MQVFQPKSVNKNKLKPPCKKAVKVELVKIKVIRNEVKENSKKMLKKVEPLQSKLKLIQQDLTQVFYGYKKDVMFIKSIKAQTIINY